MGLRNKPSVQCKRYSDKELRELRELDSKKLSLSQQGYTSEQAERYISAETKGFSVKDQNYVDKLVDVVHSNVDLGDSNLGTIIYDTKTKSPTAILGQSHLYNMDGTYHAANSQLQERF